MDWVEVVTMAMVIAMLVVVFPAAFVRKRNFGGVYVAIKLTEERNEQSGQKGHPTWR